MAAISDFVKKQASALPDGSYKSAIGRAMTAFETFSVERAKIDANPHFNLAGKRANAQNYVKANVHEVARIRKLAERAKVKQSEQRKALQPAPIDKTDSAGSTVRSELRARLASMSKAERKVFLADARTSPLYFTAVLEAPNELSGVDDETREMVLTRAIEAAHPGKLAAIERDNQSIELLNVAARVLAEHVAEVAELPNVKALDDLIDSAIPDHSRLDEEAERPAAQ